MIYVKGKDMSLDFKNKKKEKNDKHKFFEMANEAWEVKEYELALNLFKMADKSGDVYASNSIGYFYENGIGVSKNLNRALFWYKKAAKNSDVCAYSNIGILYREMGNIRRSKFWLLKAAQADDGDAFLELARLYINGKNEKNTRMAIKYLKMASHSDSITPSGLQEVLKLLGSRLPQ